MTFEEMNLHPLLLKAVRGMEFTKPTPIQEQAIPPAMEGRDLLACAMTGSGKTAAFLLPILNRLMGKPRGTTRALILTPTRELAAQIEEHLRQLAVHTPLPARRCSAASAWGRRSMPSAAAWTSSSPRRAACSTTSSSRTPSWRLEVLVLDEADRMLDMGFLPDIKRVLKHLPAKRQTLFFWPPCPRRSSGSRTELLHDPATINLERKSTPAIGIRQAALPGEGGAQAGAVRGADAPRDESGAIVFTRTKHRANRLSEILTKEGVPNARIHGNRRRRSAPRRSRLQERPLRCLVATDIVARGIDVEQLEHVVNFDVPHLPEDYIHRVGRTARADATGDAFTFVSPEEEKDLPQIERAIGKRLPRRWCRASTTPAPRALRGADRRADRRDPRAQGGRAQARAPEGLCAAQRERRGRARRTAAAGRRPRPATTASAARSRTAPGASWRAPVPERRRQLAPSRWRGGRGGGGGSRQG